MLHEIKIEKPFADAILDGRKTFEVRFNDRGYQPGDEIIFAVMNGGLKHLCHKLDGRSESQCMARGWRLKHHTLMALNNIVGVQFATF